MLLVMFAFVAMPLSITAPAAVLDGNEDARREDQQTDEGDRADETWSVVSDDSSPGRKRRCFSDTVARENTAAYWTFVQRLASPAVTPAVEGVVSASSVRHRDAA